MLKRGLKMSDSETKSIWDVSVGDIFPLVVSFYRKEKDHIVLEYEQKIQLLALFKQEKLGPFSPEKDVETGYFDMVGSNRRKAWINLGSMSQEDARLTIVTLLDAACPAMKTTVLGQWKVKNEEMEREKREAAETAKKKMLHNHQEVMDGGPERQQPANETQQKLHKSDENGLVPPKSSSAPTSPTPPPTTSAVSESNGKTEVVRNALAPAALWCKPKAAKHFISKVRATSPAGTSDYQLVINPGEVLSIQVPTSTSATAIFFEFVTEKEDIGFGLSFQRKNDKEGVEWPIEQLLPVTRRDCSEDLVLGSHQYQVQGVYNLHFDNSHSLSISKVVYYKVFYQTPTSH